MSTLTVDPRLQTLLTRGGAYTLPLSPTHGAEVDAMRHENEGWTWITRIIVPKEYRSRGFGRRIMAGVLQAADVMGITLILAPSPYPDSPLKTRQLIAWYKRLGFVDLEDGNGIMVREPKKGVCKPSS